MVSKHKGEVSSGRGGSIVEASLRALHRCDVHTSRSLHTTAKDSPIQHTLAHLITLTADEVTVFPSLVSTQRLCACMVV